MAVDTKQAYRRLIEEAFGKGNVGVFDEICDPGYRAHDPVTGDADLRQEKENCSMYRTAFPDLTPTILGCYAEGDVVTCHWRMTGTHQKALMGIQPTSARCTVEGISVGRFRGGRLLENWVQWDALGLMRQLGVAPSMGATAGTATRGTEKRPH
jgi:predicted ester cyclase